MLPRRLIRPLIRPLGQAERRWLRIGRPVLDVQPAGPATNSGQVGRTTPPATTTPTGRTPEPLVVHWLDGPARPAWVRTAEGPIRPMTVTVVKQPDELGQTERVPGVAVPTGPVPLVLPAAPIRPVQRLQPVFPLL